MEVLQGLKVDGGLNLVNIKMHDKAQKIQWVHKLSQNSKLQNLADTLIGNPIGTLLWQCHLNPWDINLIFQINSKFWRSVMHDWFEMRWKENKDRDQIKSQCIWFNSNIKIHGKRIFDKELYQKGLVWVSDMLNEENKIINLEDFKQKFDAQGKFLTYYALKRILNRYNLTDVEKTTESNFEKYSKVNILYKSLAANETLMVRFCNKWNAKLGMQYEVDSFKKIVNRIYSTTISVKLRSFQYRLLTHAIITNVHLKNCLT